MTDKYEGWSNRETWCANLWIQNDECAYRCALQLAKDAVARAIEGFEDGHTCYDGNDDEEQILANATADLAECLENDFSPEPMGGMVGDLLSTACARIDWREIAASMLADLQLVAEVVPSDPRDPEGDKCTFYRAEGL